MDFLCVWVCEFVEAPVPIVADVPAQVQAEPELKSAPVVALPTPPIPESDSSEKKTDSEADSSSESSEESKESKESKEVVDKKSA